MVAVMVVSSVVVGQAAAAPVGADDTVTVGEAAAALADVASVTGPSAVTVASSEGFTAAVAGSVVELPRDPADGLSLTTASGVSIEIGLPGAANADDGVRQASGEVVYADALPDVAVAAQPAPDGGMRALVVIDGPQAPTEFRFSIDLPAGGYLELQSDGAVNVADGDGMPAGHFDAPWAVDAQGGSVPTSYRLEGNDLIQTVEHSTNYPVVADPNYTWGWVSGTVYYTRAETRSMKTASAGGVIAAGLCAYFGAATLGAACVLSAAFWAQWNYVAGNAYADGKCIKIKIPTFWASAYSKGTCK
ncbi:MAG: hypothetical protein RLZZ362_869 [Actinomycetota bacterium]